MVARAKAFHTSVGIQLDRKACDHEPGPVNGLPCPYPGCVRGFDGIELVVEGRIYRRHFEDVRLERPGRTVEVLRCLVWFQLDDPA